MDERREYSIADKGDLILAVDFGSSIKHEADLRDIPYETARSWYRGRDDLGFPKSDSVRILKDIWAEKSGGIIEDSVKIINLANKQVIKKLSDENCEVSPRDSAVIAGIYIDKLKAMRELSGEENIAEKEFDSMSLDDQKNMIKAVYERMMDADAVDAEFEIVEEEKNDIRGVELEQ